jgi:DNA-binding beta-propeller fold protein YncE
MAHQPPTAAREEPVEADQEWLEQPDELLPRRPRRRLVGAGANPLALALLAVLLAACGFIGGVLIEKGESSSSSSTGSAASSLISRFRSLRGGTSAAGGSSASGAAASAAGASSGFTRPTAGTVAYLDGSTLYVTNAEGNTIKVTTSAATSVTKTVKASVEGIHPGETVTISGETGTNGTVSAESISVGAGGGLAALFGGGGGGAASGRSGASSSRGSEPSLFGGG